MTPRVPGNDPTPLRARLRPVRNWQVLSLVLAMFLCGAGGLTFYNFLGATVEGHLGSSTSAVTWTLLMVGIVGIAAVFGGGALVDARGPRAGRLLIVGGHAIALLAIGLYLVVGGGFGVPSCSSWQRGRSSPGLWGPPCRPASSAWTRAARCCQPLWASAVSTEGRALGQP
nr:hypothetical protein [Kytococcus sedentarius]